MDALIAYEIVNEANGKRYIGITQGRLEVRWKQHLYSAQSRQWGIISRAIAKYGPASFSIRQIASAITSDGLLLLEQQLIAQEGTLRPNGYNMTAGGGGRRSLKHTAETRAKMSRLRVGFVFSPESRAKISRSQKMRVVSEETRAKISRGRSKWVLSEASRAKLSASKMGNSSRLGMPHTLETRAKIAAANSGKTHSWETRAKLSAINTGKTLSAETRAKMSKGHIGKHHTEETKQKLSAIRRRRQAGSRPGPVVTAVMGHVSACPPPAENPRSGGTMDNGTQPRTE